MRRKIINFPLLKLTNNNNKKNRHDFPRNIYCQQKNSQPISIAATKLNDQRTIITHANNKEKRKRK